ncbi:MAG: hypothetical protein ACI86P_002468 [Flavobacteriales bacterium]|jgi:hypothetical protein
MTLNKEIYGVDYITPSTGLAGIIERHLGITIGLTSVVIIGAGIYFKPIIEDYKHSIIEEKGYAESTEKLYL